MSRTEIVLGKGTVDFPIHAERVALCGATVTINGRPAKVSGAARDYARVIDLETGLSAEWAWVTVAHVVRECGGAFKA